MAEEPRQASEDAQTGESKPTSESPGSTESLDGGVLSFDPSKKYQNPLNPEEEITGAELKAIANQGLLYRKAQSEYDTERARGEKLTAENELLQKAKDKAEAALAEKQDQERVLKTLADVGITGKPQDSKDNWYEADDETPPIDPAEVYRRVQSYTEEQVALALADLDKKSAERERQYFEKLDEQQATERYVTDNLSSARKVTLDTYRADMPDIDTAKIETVLDMETLATVKDAEAVSALRNRDKETWQALHFEAENYRTKAIKALTDLRIEQVQATTEKTRQQEIESLSRGIVPEELVDIKPAVTKADAKKNAALRLEIAKKRVAARERATNR